MGIDNETKKMGDQGGAQPESQEEIFLKQAVQEMIAEAQKITGNDLPPEELAGTIQAAIGDFMELSERYKKRAEEIKAKLEEDAYKKRKNQLLQEMVQEKNPDVLLFLSQEFAKAEDEAFGAKNRMELNESIARYFEATAKYFGTVIALENLTDSKDFIPRALEAALSRIYWKAKCAISPEMPLLTIRTITAKRGITVKRGIRF